MAKDKIFKIFHNDSKEHLVLTEIRSRKKINEKDLNYQFDVVVINIKNLKLFFKHCEDRMFRRLDQKLLPSIDHDLLFVIELDGKSHTDFRDKRRDRFYIDNYGIVTVRFQCKELVRIPLDAKDIKKVNKNINIRRMFDQDNEAPIFENITLEQILAISKEKHKEVYNHLI